MGKCLIRTLILFSTPGDGGSILFCVFYITSALNLHCNFFTLILINTSTGYDMFAFKGTVKPTGKQII